MSRMGRGKTDVKFSDIRALITSPHPPYTNTMNMTNILEACLSSVSMSHLTLPVTFSQFLVNDRTAFTMRLSLLSLSKYRLLKLVR